MFLIQIQISVVYEWKYGKNFSYNIEAICFKYFKIHQNFRTKKQLQIIEGIIEDHTKKLITENY